MRIIELAAIALLKLLTGISLAVALLCTVMLVLTAAALEALESLNERERRWRR